MKRIRKIRKKINNLNIEIKALIIVITITLVGLGGFGLSRYIRYASPQREVLSPIKGTIPYEVARVRRAVVKIEVEGMGSGSGVFIRPNLILTAGHVIDMADMGEYYHWLDEVGDEDSNDSPVEFIITCDDGTKLISIEYYRESNVDVGFLVVDSNGLDIPAILFSNNVLVGETVFTIGSPLGSLFNSVSSGIISALDRKEISYLWDSPLIQTDTPVNPGNSGGPLFNLKGEIVGIVVGGYNYADGLGLCVHSKVIYWVLRKYDAVRELEKVIGE